MICNRLLKIRRREFWKREQIIIKNGICNNSNNIVINVYRTYVICFPYFFTVPIWNKAFWNCAKSLTTFYALVYKLLGFMLQNTSFYSLFVRNKRWQRKNIVSIKEKGHCKNYGICKYMYPFKKIKFLSKSQHQFISTI